MKKSAISKPIYLLWLLCWLSLSGACQKEKLPHEVKTKEEAGQMILGEWKWERTVTQSRGQENPIYETPETENKTIHETFMKDFKLIRVETIDKISTRTDYEYDITPNSSGGDGEFLLKLTDINTNDVHQSWFRFKNKNTLVFYHGSLPFTSYYSRK